MTNQQFQRFINDSIQMGLLKLTGYEYGLDRSRKFYSVSEGLVIDICHHEGEEPNCKGPIHAIYICDDSDSLWLRHEEDSHDVISLDRVMSIAVVAEDNLVWLERHILECEYGCDRDNSDVIPPRQMKSAKAKDSVKQNACA
jgi:hypothetical protein